MIESEESGAKILEQKTIDIVRQGLAKRHASDWRFRVSGLLAISVSLLFLVLLFGSIIAKGYQAFWQHAVRLDVVIDAEILGLGERPGPEDLASANYGGLRKKTLRTMFPKVKKRKDKRALYGLVSSGADYLLQDRVSADRSLIGKTLTLWVPLDDEVDLFLKGQISRDIPEDDRRLKDKQIAWIDALVAEDRIKTRFNTILFSAGDSRDAELAGIWGALVGSFYTMFVTLLLSFPLGIATAIYLEEFAPRNFWSDFIEVNVNNLAAVPSIVYGLLGLAIFINFFGLPRSAPLVGGLVLSLMTLPTIIIASRAALKSVPPSIRQAALGIGASPMQTVIYHVLPLAMPGMLTGTIIGMARALGETAPLLMIGMVAFIVDVPQSILDPGTALPVQVYLWADSPERGFEEKTSAAIIILLVFLILMNVVAVTLRKKFEKRW